MKIKLTCMDMIIALCAAVVVIAIVLHEYVMGIMP